MANSYCTTTQFGYFFDIRQTATLGNDNNADSPDTTLLQALLDSAAAELETHLAGRVTLPLVSPPSILTRWVAMKSAEALYARRMDRPRALNEFIKQVDDWIALFDKGLVSLPLVSRTVADEPETHADERIEHARHKLTSGI